MHADSVEARTGMLGNNDAGGSYLSDDEHEGDFVVRGSSGKMRRRRTPASKHMVDSDDNISPRRRNPASKHMADSDDNISTTVSKTWASSDDDGGSESSTPRKGHRWPETGFAAAPTRCMMESGRDLFGRVVEEQDCTTSTRGSCAHVEKMRVVPGEVDSAWPTVGDSTANQAKPCSSEVAYLHPLNANACSGSKDDSSRHVQFASSTSLPRSPGSAHRRSVSTAFDCGSSAANIQVACRFRPLLSRESQSGEYECGVSFSTDAQGMPCVELSGKTFAMDRVFAPHVPQAEVYDAVARPVVQDVLAGYNGTVMAYGSTGSGKTYTMEGRAGDAQLQGIIPRMVSTLFDGIDNVADTVEFRLKLSAVEIYMERIIDLLRQPTDMSSAKVRVREDATRGIWVDAVERHVASEADVYTAARTAQASRRVAATHMNARSSRSHFILMLRLTALDMQTFCERQGVLYLVDLAGSEKVSQTGADGQTLEEAKTINRSLSCLGNVIAALTEESGRQHVPYRDSKLTRILQQSLGGNAKTCLIATCSPAASSLNETLTTLRFSERVKTVRNTPKVNEQRTMQQLLRDLSDRTKTIEALQRECASLRNGITKPCKTEHYASNIASPPVSDKGTEKKEFDASRVRIPMEGFFDDVGAELDGAHVSPSSADGHGEVLGMKARKALIEMKRELSAVKQERDAAWEHLHLAELRGACASSASRGPGLSKEGTDAGDAVRKLEEECTILRLQVASLTAAKRSNTQPTNTQPNDVPDDVRKLEDECIALRAQVASLIEGRPARADRERRLREEIMMLRDSAALSSQELAVLRREKEEMHQMLNNGTTNEAAHREAVYEQCRGYLSNRIHKVVQLEIENEVLRDTLTSLQLCPEELGAAQTFAASRQPGVAGDDDSPLGPLFDKFQDRWPGGAQFGKHRNAEKPVVRRRRQRSCERHLPGSPSTQHLGIQ